MGLPDGTSLIDVLSVLLPVAAVTLVLRALPFSFLRLLKGSPLIEFLGVHMPVGVMVVLVVYTLATSAVGGAGSMLAALLAAALTLALHAWRRSPALSIAAGTAAYMLLVNVVV